MWVHLLFTWQILANISARKQTQKPLDAAQIILTLHVEGQSKIFLHFPPIRNSEQFPATTDSQLSFPLKVLQNFRYPRKRKFEECFQPDSRKYGVDWGHVSLKSFLSWQCHANCDHWAVMTYSSPTSASACWFVVHFCLFILTRWASWYL